MQDRHLDPIMSTKKAAYQSNLIMGGVEGVEEPEFSEFEAHVLVRMNDDEIKSLNQIISRDPLIKKFGTLCMKS